VKVFLLHRDRDFDVTPGLRDEIFAAMLSGNLYAISNAKRNLDRRLRSGLGGPAAQSDDALVQDLELETLWTVMAAGDEFLYEVAKRGLLSSLIDPDAVVYRQQVLADCLAHPALIRQLYALAVETLASEREVGGLWSGAGPPYILNRSVRLLHLYLSALKQLRPIADEHAHSFQSEGFMRFFAMLRQELADDYLDVVEQHLGALGRERGVLESAELGKGDNGRSYLFHEPPEERRRWRDRLALGNRPEGYTFELDPRDEGGFRALGEIKANAINSAANALAQSADHVKSFFTVLRLELAFYLGCLNLHRWLESKRQPTCFPEPLPHGRPMLAARGLYDVCLTVHLEQPVVGNEVNADHKSLVMVTGANQGGKSTLLRSLGLAQLMMQSGMFVGAESLRASVSTGVFTHYKREEDPTMEGGKLDEELARMSEIADRIAPGALLLCNESFASTNEREGSEIARQVIRAMLDRRIKVVFVTHMYDLAHSFFEQQLDGAVFLRAERGPDGRRTFKLPERAPLPTSYGEDSYRRIFGNDHAGPASRRHGADTPPPPPLENSPTSR
jgi:hypothetical protein